MIYLERHDPKKNLYRFYRLSLEKNLFGEWSLMREWGRIGRPSQQKIEIHTTEQDAQASMARKERQKQRKGYA